MLRSKFCRIVIQQIYHFQVVNFWESVAYWSRAPAVTVTIQKHNTKVIESHWVRFLS